MTAPCWLGLDEGGWGIQERGWQWAGPSLPLSGGLPENRGSHRHTRCAQLRRPTLVTSVLLRSGLRGAVTSVRLSRAQLRLGCHGTGRVTRVRVNRQVGSPCCGPGPGRSVPRASLRLRISGLWPGLRVHQVPLKQDAAKRES